MPLPLPVCHVFVHLVIITLYGVVAPQPGLSMYVQYCTYIDRDFGEKLGILHSKCNETRVTAWIYHYYEDVMSSILQPLVICGIKGIY